MLSTIFAGAYQAKQLVQLLRGVILTVAGTVCKGLLHWGVDMGVFGGGGGVFCAQQVPAARPAYPILGVQRSAVRFLA
ncbi:hypothetical protein [Massilia glaciei]|uniref:hypothetical protein n=1 Tax=Massilia glaciei TaxID=1524097 RepID=UPI0011B28248|nr:hypothetical protein [Massilia glaciei]